MMRLFGRRGGDGNIRADTPNSVLHATTEEEQEARVMETAHEKLEAIGQIIRTGCVSTQEAVLHIDLPRELCGFLEEGLSKGCDLGLVPTITGSPNEAFAATVKDYMEFAWPSTELVMLELLTKARDGDGCAEVSSDRLEVSIAPALSIHGDDMIWRVEVRAVPDELITFAHQICWLCACFRPTFGSCISSSDVFIRPVPGSSMHIEICLADLQPVPKLEPQPGQCWHRMFQNFVIATRFPIPARENQKGIELPLELMLALSRVRYPLDCLETVVFKGHSTALIPMSQTTESFQWHFESQQDRTQPIELDIITNICQTALKGVDLESLCDSSKRHFLGLWERAEIHLGTEDSNYKTISRSGADEESSKPVIVQEIPITIGTSGGGIFGVQCQAKFAWSKAVEVELLAEDRLLMDVIRQTGESASILYDNETKCGWLVSELSLIYELILAWAVRQNEPHRSVLLSHLPRANVDHGLGQAVSELLENEGNKVILPKSTIQGEINLLQRFIAMFNAFKKRKEQVRLKGKEGFKLWPTRRSSTLYGWDFDDIASQVQVARRRQIAVPYSSGGWATIASRNPDIVVVLCTKAGFPIRAKNGVRICDYWTPLPPPNAYLIASVPTLLSLSKSFTGDPTTPRLSADSLYCRRRQNSDLFDPCRFNSAGHTCNRLQKLGKRLSKDCLSFQARGAEGAVVFGANMLSRRDPCRRFRGYVQNQQT